MMTRDNNIQGIDAEKSETPQLPEPATWESRLLACEKQLQEIEDRHEHEDTLDMEASEY